MRSLVAVLVSVAAMQAAAAAADFPVWGVANQTCGQWNSDKQDAASRAIQRTYMAGYLTALNIASHSDQADGKTALAETVAEVDRICARPSNEKLRLADALNVITGLMLAKALADARFPHWEPGR